MHYVVHAYDHTDSAALDRRMAARPAHFEYVRQLKERGEFILGGALLDPDGKMIGSMLLLNLESQARLDDYLQNDPYIVQGVWETIDVKPFRQASV